MKFIHAADIHLDSPLRGLERYEGAPVEAMRNASRRALENAVALAIAETVDFFLIAGDIYDGDWKDYNTGLFFARQMARLRDANIRVCLIKGNHDAASQISRELKLPDNVSVLPAHQCGTVRWEDAGLAIHGQSLSNQSVSEDLSVNYPPALAGYFNIGMLHTSATGREGHENYAPCSVDGLLSKGYDYWALGHVHRREVLHESPWILFPGNLQGRHARETGPKGCTLVTVDGGHVRRVEFRAVDVARWSQCVVTAPETGHYEELLDTVRQALETELRQAEDRVMAVRLMVEGRCQAHAKLVARGEQFVNECRSLANDIGGGQIWVEKVRLRTQASVDFERLLQRQDPLGDLARYLRALPEDTAVIAEMRQIVKDLRLPPEAFTGSDTLDLNTPETFKPLLRELEQILIPRLLDQEEGR